MVLFFCLLLICYGMFSLFGDLSSKFNKHRRKDFNPSKDLISLHYDHAPDKDHGQSAAPIVRFWNQFSVSTGSKRTSWLFRGIRQNAAEFNVNSDAVMDAAWNDCGGWLPAHTNRTLVANN